MRTELWGETLEGGTSKNPDKAENAKKLYLDAKAGGNKLHKLLEDMGFTNTGYVIWKALKDGHFKHLEELNIIAANTKRLRKETRDIMKQEYPNYEIPNQPFDYRIDRNKVLDPVEFNEFMVKAAEPHIFLGISKEQYDALGAAGVKKFHEAIERRRNEIASSGLDPLRIGEPGAGQRKNPFNPTGIVLKNDAFEYEFMRRFGDNREGLIGSQITYNRFQATKAAEKSVMSDRPSLQFKAMRDYALDRFEDLSPNEAALRVEKMADYWRGTYHPSNSLDSTFALIGLGVKQFINASLLGFVNGRNITIDNTLYHGVVKTFSHRR